MRSARIGAACVIATLIGACRERAPEPPPGPPAPVRATRVAKGAELPLGEVPHPLRVVITPVFAPKEMKHDYAPLVAHLAEAIGSEPALEAPKDYAATVDLLLRGQADVIQLAPLTYVVAKEKVPSLEILVTNISEGSSTYSGYLVARAGAGLRTVEDLRGKILGFVDKESTSGYLYPYAFLLQHGVDPEHYFKKIVFTGRHDAALEMLVNGEIDAAATFSGALLNAETKNIDTEQLEIVAKTGRIPYDAWCVRGDLSPGVKQRLRTTLLELSTRTPAGRHILGPLRSINGFAPSSDETYEEVRKVKKLVDQATE